MSLEQIISTYGYYAVGIFACIEGEIAIITAGILASQGVLSLHLVMLFAFLGTWITEQILFFVGRFYGPNVLSKFPKLKPKAERIFNLIHKYDSLYIFFFRFIYGIRNISPLVIGSAKVSPKKYCILNFLAAAIWSVVIPSIGFLFSKFIKQHINDVHTYFIVLGLFLLLISILPYILYRMKHKKHK